MRWKEPARIMARTKSDRTHSPSVSHTLDSSLPEGALFRTVGSFLCKLLKCKLLFTNTPINGRSGYQNLTTSAGLPNEEKVAVASVI